MGDGSTSMDTLFSERKGSFRSWPKTFWENSSRSSEKCCRKQRRKNSVSLHRDLLVTGNSKANTFPRAFNEVTDTQRPVIYGCAVRYPNGQLPKVTPVHYFSPLAGWLGAGMGQGRGHLGLVLKVAFSGSGSSSGGRSAPRGQRTKLKSLRSHPSSSLPPHSFGQGG